MAQNSALADSNGIAPKGADAYIRQLKNSGFKLVENEYDDEVRLYKYVRVDGELCQVEIRQRENDELSEFTCYFQCFADGEWPKAWRDAGIPQPGSRAIVDKIDMESWNDRQSWYGSFRQRVKLMDADLDAYAALLRKNGFTKPEYSDEERWELEKRLKIIDGAWCLLTVGNTDNEDIPELDFNFVLEDR